MKNKESSTNKHTYLPTDQDTACLRAILKYPIQSHTLGQDFRSGLKYRIYSSGVEHTTLTGFDSWVNGLLFG